MPFRGSQEGAAGWRDGHGRYVVERTLGRGGMATVYLARDTALERHVAIKVLADELADDADAKARFLREARLAARLVHPAVVRVYDVGTGDAGPYIVMEHVAGPTLAAELARRGRLPAATVAALGVELSAALEAAHAAGLVHRDVKPQNVLLTADGDVKLADFGIARAVDSTVLTAHGAVLGTLAYLAPEQARGEHVGAAADLYAVGVVLYEALTGRRPHEGASAAEIVARRERAVPAPPSMYVPDVPRDLERAILRCLAPRPAARPQSAAALGRDLARSAHGSPAGVLATEPAAAVEPTLAVTEPLRTALVTTARGRHGGALAAFAAAAVLAALAVVVGLRSRDGGGPSTSATTSTAPVRATAPRTASTASPPTGPTAAAAHASAPSPACADLRRRRDELQHRRRDVQKALKHDKPARDAQRAALDRQRRALAEQLAACAPGPGADG
jgi:serine/threonine-protein kinase